MKVEIKKKLNHSWVDISEYVNIPFSIKDVDDKTYDQTKIEFDVFENFGDFDFSKALEPKLYLKISGDSKEYVFRVDNTEFDVLRTETDNYKPLYRHTLSCLEYSQTLEDTLMPNYTITQPKTEYFDVYSRYGNKRYTVNGRFQNDGTKPTLPQGTVTNSNFINNVGNIISVGYSSGKHFVELKDINDVGYDITVGFNIAKTAKTTFGVRDIFAATGTQENLLKNASDTTFKITTYYYNLSTLVETTVKTETVKYNGGNVTVDTLASKILSFPQVSKQELRVSVPQKNNATRAYVEIELDILPLEYNVRRGYRGAGQTKEPDFVYMQTDISNFTNNTYNKVFFQDIEFSIQSGQLKEPVAEKKITMIEFLDKALFDYNLNKEFKFSYSDRVRTTMNFIAKESEWNGYTFKELLDRAFEYVGGTVYLNENNVIDIIIPTSVSRNIELEKQPILSKEYNGLEFFDKAVSNTKNLMSDDDFVTETTLIGSTSTEFSQLRDDDNNAGFLFSQDVYFTNNAILYAPDISFTINGNVINTNMDKPYFWDITSRLLEEDIYNALPDVRFDTKRDSTEQIPSGRATGELCKGNTIYFKSGSNYIKGIYHKAPNIPTYHPANLVVNSDPAEYAIIEMLICLAYETLSVPAYTIPDITPNIIFNDTTDFEITLKYCPIYKELTTKYLSGNKNRKGLNWEKSFNLSDRVVSFEDNERVLKDEMDKKGNETLHVTEYYNNLDEVIDVSSILPNGYYVSKCVITIDNELIEALYTLSERNLITNQDVGLSVEYERYAVPYEYVQREMMLEEHWLFSNENKLDLNNLPHISNVELFRAIYQNENINGQLYALYTLNYDDSFSKKVIQRISKIESKNNLVLSGKFIDNYSAGNQRFVGDLNNNSNLYSIPFRYTDYNGKVKEVWLNSIGYATNNSSNDKYNRLGIRRKDTQSSYAVYPMERFPQHDFFIGVDEYEAALTYSFTEETMKISTLKDAREALTLNMMFFKDNLEEDFKMYHFRPINRVAKIVLPDDFELVDDLTFDDIQQYITNIEPNNVVTTVSQTSGLSQIIFNTPTVYTSGSVALLNVTGNNYTLVGINKNPNYISGNIRYYCYNKSFVKEV